MTGPEKEAFAVLAPLLGGELASDIITHRRGLKCPLTGRGARSLVREYQKTGSAVAAAEYHLNMGWRGFFADWMKQKGRAAGSTDMADFASEAMDIFYERTLPTDRH